MHELQDVDSINASKQAATRCKPGEAQAEDDCLGLLATLHVSTPVQMVLATGTRPGMVIMGLGEVQNCTQIQRH